MSENTDSTTTTPTDDVTLTELRARASELNIAGRSTMSKDELAAAIADAEQGALDGNPSDPDNPDDGRPPAAEVAAERRAVTYTRNLDGDDVVDENPEA